jgi:hypothetical protein
MAASTPAKASFMGMPAELRLPIYEHALGQPTRFGNATPDLLRTCKQVYTEAATIYHTHSELMVPLRETDKENPFNWMTLNHVPSCVLPYTRTAVLTTHILPAETLTSGVVGVACRSMVVKLPKLESVTVLLNGEYLIDAIGGSTDLSVYLPLEELVYCQLIKEVQIGFPQPWSGTSMGLRGGSGGMLAVVEMLKAAIEKRAEELGQAIDVPVKQAGACRWYLWYGTGTP